MPGVAAVTPARSDLARWSRSALDLILHGDPATSPRSTRVPRAARRRRESARRASPRWSGRQRDQLRHRQREPARPRADRAAGAASDGGDPRDPAAGDRRAARAARQRRPLVRGTLGVSILFIRFVVGDAGFDSSIPVFAFIFLVALGIDYTIFLMARVREEARRHGTREGMLRAIAATGPVITSAGVILAGTFSVLMTLPVTFTFDLGFMVALGILLDTFIVRTIMVPAAIELIGDKIWWPSTAQSRRPHPRGHRRAPRTRPAGDRASGPSSPACASRRRPRSPRGSPREAKHDSRSSISSRSLLRVSARRARERVDRALVAPHRERRVGGDLGGQLDRRALELVVVDHLVDEARSPPRVRRRCCGRCRKSSLVRGTPIASMKRRRPVWQ